MLGSIQDKDLANGLQYARFLLERRVPPVQVVHSIYVLPELPNKDARGADLGDLPDCISRDLRVNLKAMDFTRAISLSPEVESAIEDAFEYHKWDDAKVKQGAAVREALANAVKAIVQNVPPGPDRTVAIRKCREARMDANSAITHGGKY